MAAMSSQCEGTVKLQQTAIPWGDVFGRDRGSDIRVYTHDLVAKRFVREKISPEIGKNFGVIRHKFWT